MEAKNEYTGAVWCAAALVLGISRSGARGWAFDIAVLRSFGPGWPAMRVSTALGSGSRRGSAGGRPSPRGFSGHVAVLRF